ncbi:MAG: M23 family metallopeptidase [bacterium]
MHRIPFPAGYKTRVTQGFHGAETHGNAEAFAVDLLCEEGDPVVASHSGKVWSIKEDSNHGCADPICQNDANYVILDHGDGTFSHYHHLRYLGALVKPGDDVCAGQIIGICGTTGYSGGPHLHFELADARSSMPVQFVEGYHQKGIGTPIPRDTYTSENTLMRSCRTNGYSTLDAGAFAHQGIVLTSTLSSVVENHQEWVVEGQYFGDQPKVALHRRSTAGGAWLTECVPRQPDGDFSMTVQWDQRRFQAGGYLIMMTGADEDCLTTDWAWSYPIQVR